MAIVSNGALFDVLRHHQLLSPQQLAEVLALAQGRCSDVRSLAKSLIQRGWFTVYQMNQLLASHGAELVLGPYHILDRLGKGGQSMVYKALHPDYGWIVALKVIRAEHLATAESAEQFLQEMEAMAQLDHPNIVQFWDADKAGDVYYCAMEFIEGTDLGKVVRLTGALGPPLACEYIRQTALGLQHAHEHNLVHRDIKPVNLYLTQPLPVAGQPTKPTPLVKILDWGLASLRPTIDKVGSADKVSRAHSVIGTADYMSPEQAVQPNGVDIRSDIYSLGCTLYYLLTGQVPFGGNTVMQKIIQHQKAEPVAVENLNREVAPALAAIVRRMMAKKPEDRFQTPAAVALALQPFCREGTQARIAKCRDTAQRTPRRQPGEDTPMPSGTLGGGRAKR